MKEITDDNFIPDVLKNEKPVLVDFWAPWCAPCRLMAPELEKVSEELGESIIISKMNVDENQVTAGQLGIMSIPTLALFKDGDVAWSAVGLKPAKMLVEEIRSVIE